MAYYYRRRWRRTWRPRWRRRRWRYGRRRVYGRRFRVRRRRVRRRRLRRRPKNTFHWQPRVVKRLKIKGYYPGLYGIKWFSWQPTQDGYSVIPGFTNAELTKVIRPGGCYDSTALDLNSLYWEHFRMRNTWSTSNDTLDLIQYWGCKFRLWPDDNWPYIFHWSFDTSAIKNELLLTHPWVALRLPNRRIVWPRKYGHRKATTVRIKPPPTYEQRWYYQRDFANTVLVRYHCSLFDASDIWFNPDYEPRFAFAYGWREGDEQGKWKQRVYYYPTTDFGRSPRDAKGQTRPNFFARDDANNTQWSGTQPTQHDLNQEYIRTTLWEKRIEETVGLPLWLGAWVIEPKDMKNANFAVSDVKPKLFAVYWQKGNPNAIVVHMDLMKVPPKAPADVWWSGGDVTILRALGPLVPKTFDRNWSIMFSYTFYFKLGGQVPTEDISVQDPRYQPPLATDKFHLGLQTGSIIHPSQAGLSTIHDWDLRRGLLTKRALKRITKSDSSSTDEEEAQEPGGMGIGRRGPQRTRQELYEEEEQDSSESSGSSTETEEEDAEAEERRHRRQQYRVEQFLRRLRRWARKRPAQPPRDIAPLKLRRLLQGL